MVRGLSAIVASALCSVVLGQSYSIRPLDPLPGYVGSGALGVAENGDAAGYSVDRNGKHRATIWRNGQAIDVGGLAAFDWSEAVGISTLQTFAVRGEWLGRKRSILVETPTTLLFEEFTVMDVSETGYICGIRPLEPGLLEYTAPFLWYKGQFKSVSRLTAGRRHESIGVGATGEPVGLFALDFVPSSCYWRLEDPSSPFPTYWPWLGGGCNVLNDINGNRTMVGERYLGSSSEAVKFRHFQGATTLGSISGFLRHAPLGINNSEIVVGRASYLKEESTAVVWHGGIQGRRLVDLLTNDENWALIEAMRVSDSGYVVGTGRKNGMLLAFRMDRRH